MRRLARESGRLPRLPLPRPPSRLLLPCRPHCPLHEVLTAHHEHLGVPRSPFSRPMVHRITYQQPQHQTAELVLRSRLGAVLQAHPGLEVRLYRCSLSARRAKAQVYAKRSVSAFGRAQASIVRPVSMRKRLKAEVAAMAKASVAAMVSAMDESLPPTPTSALRDKAVAMAEEPPLERPVIDEPLEPPAPAEESRPVPPPPPTIPTPPPLPPASPSTYSLPLYSPPTSPPPRHVRRSHTPPPGPPPPKVKAKARVKTEAAVVSQFWVFLCFGSQL